MNLALPLQIEGYVMENSMRMVEVRHLLMIVPVEMAEEMMQRSAFGLIGAYRHSLREMTHKDAQGSIFGKRSRR